MMFRRYVADNHPGQGRAENSRVAVAIGTS